MIVKITKDYENFCRTSYEEAVRLTLEMCENREVRIKLIPIIFNQLMEKSPVENYWEWDKK